MPRYVYVCPECGEEVEAVHGMNENPDMRCSHEEKAYIMVRKIFEPASVRVEGGTPKFHRRG